MAINVGYTVAGSKATIIIDGHQTITWEVSGAEFTAENGNFALLAALPKAMRERTPLHVQGSVDRRLIRNAQLQSHFWEQWRPKLYGAIEISADEIIDEEPGGRDNAICLSGGVDSTFAYLATVAGGRDALRADVSLGIFVRGFDFELEDAAGFEAVLSQVRQVVHDRSTRIAAVTTNWKQELCGPSKAEWEHVHPVGLAAILHLFRGEIGSGIIGSDYTFFEDHMVAPWGSNATSNRLLGSRGFSIDPVGEHATRLKKIAAIQAWGKLAQLRVCWAGPRTGENCARCEKCLRTMLMCEALGLDSTVAFGRTPEPSEIRDLNLRSLGKIAFIQQALNAPNNRLRPEIKRAARSAIVRSHIRNRIKATLAPIRDFVMR